MECNGINDKIVIILNVMKLMKKSMWNSLKNLNKNLNLEFLYLNLQNHK